MLQYTQYTDNIPQNFGGYAMGPFVKIRPKYKDDKGLHNHEYEHVRQFWFASIIGVALISAILYGLFLNGMFEQYLISLPIIGFATHAGLYSISKKYKLWTELEAYAIQLNTYGTKEVPEWLISSLTTKYGLDVSRETVISELTKRLH